jgi:hypothetical protein
MGLLLSIHIVSEIRSKLECVGRKHAVPPKAKGWRRFDRTTEDLKSAMKT